MTDYVLTGLVKRRAELTGESDALRAKLARIAADLGHLDAVIRLFDPEYDTATIRPKRPQGADVAKRGERGRALLDVLRNASEPLPTAEVVRRALVSQGQDPENRTLARHFAKRVEAALARQGRRGVVLVRREPGQVVLWEVAR